MKILHIDPHDLELTPQKPFQRACQRDTDAIHIWQQEIFQALAWQAKSEGTEIFVWDESGFRADTVRGKIWVVCGQTPVVQRLGKCQSISAASAVNDHGAFWLCTLEGALNAELFVELLKQLIKYRRKGEHLMLDSLPAHKTAFVKKYVTSTEVRLTLHYLPGYAPSLNPNELVLSHVKRTGAARRPLKKGDKRRYEIEKQLAALQKLPHLVHSFFKAPSVASVMAQGWNKIFLFHWVTSSSFFLRWLLFSLAALFGGRNMSERADSSRRYMNIIRRLMRADKILSVTT